MRIAVAVLALTAALAWAGQQAIAQQGAQQRGQSIVAGNQDMQLGGQGPQAYQAFRPNVGGGEQWRYRFHNGQWWYWLPDNRWVYWRNDQWINYDANTYRAPAMAGQTGTFGYRYSNAPDYDSSYDSSPYYRSYGYDGYYAGRLADEERREAFGRGFGGGSGFAGGIGGMRGDRESFDALGFGGGSGFAGGLGGMRGESYSGPGYAGGSGFAGGIVGMDGPR